MIAARLTTTSFVGSTIYVFVLIENSQQLILFSLEPGSEHEVPLLEPIQKRLVIRVYTHPDRTDASHKYDIKLSSLVNSHDQIAFTDTCITLNNVEYFGKSPMNGQYISLFLSRDQLSLQSSLMIIENMTDTFKEVEIVSRAQENNQHFQLKGFEEKTKSLNFQGNCAVVIKNQLDILLYWMPYYLVPQAQNFITLSETTLRNENNQIFKNNPELLESYMIWLYSPKTEQEHFMEIRNQSQNKAQVKILNHQLVTMKEKQLKTSDVISFGIQHSLHLKVEIKTNSSETYHHDFVSQRSMFDVIVIQFGKCSFSNTKMERTISSYQSKS